MAVIEPGGAIVGAGGAVVPLVVIGLAAALTAVLAMRFPTATTRTRVAALGVLAVAAYVAAGQTEAIGRFEEFGGVYYAGPQASATPDSLDEDVILVDARPNEPFRMAVTVTNASLLPITIVGIERLGTAFVGPRFVGAELLKDPNAFAPESGGTVPFSPTTLGPGERVDIVAVVDPGGCVSLSSQSGRWHLIESIPIVYDVLGWRRTVQFKLPEAAAIPAPESCP